MYLNELKKEAIELFNKDIPQIKEAKAAVYKRREDFVNHFTISTIQNLKVEEYALGLECTTINFCNYLENELLELGKMGVAFQQNFRFIMVCMVRIKIENFTILKR